MRFISLVNFVMGFTFVMVLSAVVVCVTGFSGCVYLFIPSWGVTVVGWGVVCGMRVMGWCVSFWVGVWFMVCGIIGYGLQHGGVSFRVEERPAICGIA